jgi:predicted alpha/beta superfamily hydrolase
MNRLNGLGVVLALSLSASPVMAFGPADYVAPKSMKPAEVAIPLTRRVDFVSEINGQHYSLLIALPRARPPAGGYPVLYVLDGVAYFGTAAETARMAGRPIAVVGISYPFDDPAFVAQTLGQAKPTDGGPTPQEVAAATQVTRNFDLTLPTTPAYMAALKVPGMGKAHVGGVDDLLRVIEREIKPKVGAILPIDSGDQALFGHSFGGLAVLRALMTEPQAFRTFIAASPSIWWSDGAVLAGESAFSVRVAKREISPRILLTAGGQEEAPIAVPAGMPISQADADKLVLSNRMVGNLVDLAARLKGLKASPVFDVQAVVFAGETHTSVAPAAISRAVSFIAAPPISR